MKKIDSPIFELKKELSDEHILFFKEHGFLHFKNFIPQEKVEEILDEVKKIQDKWIKENVLKVNGIPIRYGFDHNNNKIVHRFVFSSLYSSLLRDFLKDERFQSLTRLLNRQGRIGELEKDGMVINQYYNNENSKYKQLGWHTDALRDVFYLKKIGPMLNVGVHLDTIPSHYGGLRILPGTHKQSIFNFLFRKTYFFNTKKDPNEVGLDIDAGDLTIHDGRMWHRVAPSKFVGEKSKRRVIYIPVITGKYTPKNEKTKTPLYHKFQFLLK